LLAFPELQLYTQTLLFAAITPVVQAEENAVELATDPVPLKEVTKVLLLLAMPTLAAVLTAVEMSMAVKVDVLSGED
jgi:hypothetical protein